MKLVRLVSLALVAGAFAAIGCSSSDSGSPLPVVKDGAVADTKDSAPVTNPPADTGTTPADTATSDPDNACGAKPTNSACQSCCGTNHAAGQQAFAQVLLTCACKAGVCATQCAATACAATPAAPDAACQTCINNSQSGACKTDLTTCISTGPCVDWYNCVDTQKCLDLP